MKKIVFLIALLLLGVVIIAGQCGATAATSGPQLEVLEPWARPSPMMAGNGAVYLVLQNNGGAPDALIGAQTNVAEVVEIHETKMEGDMMKMSPVSKIEVPAGKSVALKPGGLHIMLINLQQELVAGEKIELALNFEQSDSITVQADIRDMTTGLDSE